jgi:hypothetical protein
MLKAYNWDFASDNLTLKDPFREIYTFLSVTRNHVIQIGHVRANMEDISAWIIQVQL